MHCILRLLSALADSKKIVTAHHTSHYRLTGKLTWQTLIKSSANEYAAKFAVWKKQNLRRDGYIVQNGADLAEEAKPYLQLKAIDPQKEAFLSAVCAKPESNHPKCIEDGFLQLAFLEIGGKKAAGYLNFDTKSPVGLQFRH